LDPSRSAELRRSTPVQPTNPKKPVNLGEPNVGDPLKVRSDRFDGLYRHEAEPFSYSRRAAEVFRHEYVARTVRSLRPNFGRILDVGCSVGQLTARLRGASPEVYGIDVSPTAIGRARARCDEARRTPGIVKAGAAPMTTEFHFAAADSLDLPFPSATFDLVLICDGLHSWRLTPAEQTRTLEEVHRLLTPGGLVLLTEHLKPAQFHVFVGRVRASPLAVFSVRYLHDRLWYGLERNLRPFADRPATQAILANRAVAHGLRVIASLAGHRGAKHLCIVAGKPR
jgi:SAM-dependent methyltransferase